MRAGHVGVVVRERRVVVPAPFPARLIERYVQPGDPVREGQPLARFDSGSVESAARVAEAAVREARAALSLARVEADQARGRHERRQDRRELFSEEQLEEVETGVEVAAARVAAAEARLASASVAAREARADFEEAVLRAPLSGIVDAVYGSPGMQDERGDPVVAIEAGDFHVRFAAPPVEARGLTPGDPVEVWAGEPEPFAGVVIHAAPELDPRTLLVTFEALLCAELPAGTPVRVLPAAPDPAGAAAGPRGCPGP